MAVGAHLVRHPHVHHHLVDGAPLGWPGSRALGGLRVPERGVPQVLHVVDGAGALRCGAPAKYGAEAGYYLEKNCIKIYILNAFRQVTNLKNTATVEMY